MKTFGWREAVVLAVAFGVLSIQVLLPGFIGLANNGDFGKIAGPLSLEGVDHGAENFLYFQPNYSRGPLYYYNSHLPSSEHLVAWIAAHIEERVNPSSLDIRWVGVVHLLGWIAGFALVLASIRGLRAAFWWIAASAALFVFTDVAYVSYFNSFYTDSAALIGAMAMLGALPAVIEFRAGWLPFGLAALLFVTSKEQHAISIIAAAIVLLATRRITGLAMAAVLICGSAWVIESTPVWYRSESRFSTIFFRLLPLSEDPARDAAELGLAPSDLQYVGTHAFSPHTPLLDPSWVQGFDRRGGFGSLARFYLRHPRMTLRFLWKDLREMAWRIRPPNLSNFSREQGQPAGARTCRFAWWSDLRSWQLLHAPALMIAWYAVAWIGAPMVALRTRSRMRALAWSLFFATSVGLGEFCVASLADVIETYRHLLLFHLMTDFSFWFALQMMIDFAAARPVRMQSEIPMPS